MAQTESGNAVDWQEEVYQKVVFLTSLGNASGLLVLPSVLISVWGRLNKFAIYIPILSTFIKSKRDKCSTAGDLILLSS